MPEEIEDGEVPLLGGRTEPSAPLPRRRRLRDRWVLLTAVGIFGLLVVGGVAGALTLRHGLDRNIERIADPFEALPSRPPTFAPVPAAPDEDSPQNTSQNLPQNPPLNVLVLGSDSRISAGDPSQWQRGAQRTDAIMLVHVSADRTSATVMSIPRDSWVEIPGHGVAKINAAFSWGGPTLLIQTVEQLTNVRIDHFVATDFESFKAITDQLGGVYMTLNEDLYDRRTLVLPAGYHLMTGEQALVYVRQRFGLARGDFDRVQRQQAWIRAILTQVRSEQTLKSPTTWVPFLETVTRSVSVDEGLTMNVMTDLLVDARNLDASNIDFITVPLDGISTSADGQSIVLLDRPAFDALMLAVAEDRVPEYLAANPDDVDRLGGVAP